MTANEAYNIAKDNVGTRKIIACIEYNDYYLFSTVPKNYKPMTDDGKINIPFDSSFLVNKNNGELSVYNPMFMDIGEDYKIVEDFK